MQESDAVTDEDERNMRHCLTLAEAALAKGEVPVGALVVRDGRVVGEGIEATRALCDPTAHAEVRAIRAACATDHTTTLENATLYTTVEPCVLCGYAARSVRIARLVYGAPAGQLGACHAPYSLMTDAANAAWGPPPSIVQALAADCAALLERYASQRRPRAPRDFIFSTSFSNEVA